MSICPKISVIIPVYNAEKYLRKCLDSVILQTYRNLEILCVNDGSTDGSADILREYRAKDDRVRVFEQEHSGTANARNYAMTAANGEYLSFVDADDWLLLSLYEIFVKLNPNAGVDIYNFNDNIRFLENKIFEHQLFHMQTFMKAETILVSSETYYRYRISNESAVSNSLGSNVFDIFDIFENISDTVRAAGVEDAYKYAVFQYKYTQLNTLFHKIRFSLKQKFFEKMKSYLQSIDMSGFDMEICKKLTNFYLYEDILNNDWIHYSLGKINTANPLAQVKTLD